jgi:tetratricopeptide (TPR) repeat protein
VSRDAILGHTVRVGDLIGERFQIEAVAGSGGMGKVYRCRDRSSGQLAAVKVLEKLTLDHARRFERESWILSEIEHPGVVGYLGQGVMPDGRPFLAMQWLAGEDLRQRLDRGRLGFEDTVLLGRQVASALAEAHRRGIVHRDIKPGNLFLDQGEVQNVRVLDFGVARFSQTSVDATQMGQTIGTPAYMSPEQARGEVDLDARADVFSLGCVLFECITGRPPFVGGSLMAILAKILLEDVPRLRDIDEGVDLRLDLLIARMLEKEPSDRIGDMATVEAELAGLAHGDAAPSPARHRAPRITRGERRLLSIVATTPTGPTATQRGGEDQTIAELSVPETNPQTTVSRLGGRIETLADGSHIAVVERSAEAADQAATAARAALALMQQFPGVGVAVATGRGIVAGRLPVGEVIDRATRLLPRRGQARHAVRIDETTAAFLDSRFVLGRDELGLCLVAERDVGGGVRTLLGRPTLCIGRDMELAVLESLHESCIADGRAQAVLVTGPSGIGKSRIRHEFLDRLQRREVEAEVLLARGQEVAAGSAFGLLAPAVRRVLGLGDGERGEEARSKVEARVARRLPDDQVRRVAEFLGELVGVPFDDAHSPPLAAARQDPRLMGDQLEAAFIDFVGAECLARPVLIVVEDLQWGDAPTIRFIDAALRALADQPLLVLALGRPDVAERFPDLWAERDVHQLRIKPLSQRASIQLLRSALGPDRSPALLERLAERAGGNAFFLEELARSAAESPNLEELPDTVLAMVEARLQALHPEARLILRAASVYGRAFWAKAVAALLGHNEPEQIEQHLQDLARRELVSVRRGGRFPNWTEYVFRNAVVQEAAYAMLTPGDRSLGHELAGRWLEAAGESDPTVLAEHFDRGGNAALAAEWLAKASTLALEGNDFEGALAHAERALGISDERRINLPELLRGQLVLARGIALSWLGQYGPAREAAHLAFGLLPRCTIDWYRAIELIMTTGSRVGEYGEAIDRQADVLEQPSPGARGAWAVCLCSAARALFQIGEYVLAETMLARLCEASERPEEIGPWAIAEIHRLRGARARHVGDVAEDLRWYEASLAAFEQAGDTRLACNTRVSVAFAYIEVGDFEAAEQALQRAMVDADRHGLSTVRTRVKQNLGLLRGASGALAEAQALLDEVIDTSVRRGDVRFAAWTRIYAANVALRLGDFARARAEAEEAARELEITPPARAGAIAALARVEAAEGRNEAAINAADEAWGILSALGGIEEFEALVHVARIEALIAVGRRNEARAAAEQAIARVRSFAAGLDESRRAGFFERVPENAALHALLVTLGGATGI